MAFVKVTVPEPEDMDEEATFQKFQSIGDKMAGVFLSKVTTQGNFGKAQVNYKFRNAQGLVICTPPWHLKQLFEAANAGAGLKRGDKVIAKYVDDKPMTGVGDDGQPKNPMKKFDLLVDDGKGAPTKPSVPQGKPAPKPQPKPPEPKPQGDEDFSDFDGVDVPY